MPQPIQVKAGLSRSTGSESIGEHAPECIRMIGMIAIAWTEVEKEVNATLAGIYGRTSTTPDEGWAVNPNWIVAEIMKRIETNHARINVANALLTPLLERHPLLQDWNSIVERLRRRARERNLAVHTAWGWTDSKPDGLIEPPKAGSVAHWNLEDFDAMYKRIAELTVSLRLFMRSALRAIHDREITAHIEPGMIVEGYPDNSLDSE